MLLRVISCWEIMGHDSLPATPCRMTPSSSSVQGTVNVTRLAAPGSRGSRKSGTLLFAGASTDESADDVPSIEARLPARSLRCRFGLFPVATGDRGPSMSSKIDPSRPSTFPTRSPQPQLHIHRQEQVDSVLNAQIEISEEEKMPTRAEEEKIPTRAEERKLATHAKEENIPTSVEQEKIQTEIEDEEPIEVNLEPETKTNRHSP